MGTWNYRVVEHKCSKTGEVFFQIHEVFYNKNGAIAAVSRNPTTPQGGDKESLGAELSCMSEALDKPVLCIDDIKFEEPDWSLGTVCLDDLMYSDVARRHLDHMPDECRNALGTSGLAVGFTKEHHWFVADTNGCAPGGNFQKNAFCVKWSERHYEGTGAENEDLVYDLIPWKVHSYLWSMLPDECRAVAESDGESDAVESIGWNEELGWFVVDIRDVVVNILDVMWSEKPQESKNV